MNQVVFLGTYPPRECGIATFTQDISSAIHKKYSPKLISKIVAMQNCCNYDYQDEVIDCIEESDINEYIRVAKKLNKDDRVKLVCIQHEFGIFGGKYINYLAPFLETIKKPVVTTLHSVVPDPPECVKSTLKYLSVKSSALIVMADKAQDILKQDYGVNSDVFVIHHGIHNVPYEPSRVQKQNLGLSDRKILSSFGLISGGKFYEPIIKALPTVIKKHPDVTYLIVGATHPGIVKKEGEKYRHYLMGLIEGLGLQDNVKFINRYLELDELLQYLRATDVFVSSGRGLTQIVSGTLSYALGCGRPVITIPFLHAKEAVTPERGILVEMGNPDSYADAILELLSDPEKMEKMGQNAYEYTRHMVWENVAKQYVDVFRKYLTDMTPSSLC